MRIEQGRGLATLSGMTQRSPFRCFRTSPEIMSLAVMLYVRFPSVPAERGEPPT